MTQDDFNYLTTLLAVTPYLVGNITSDLRPYPNGYQAEPAQCSANATERVLQDRSWGIAYGWLVGRLEGRFTVVGHIVNTKVNHEYVLETGRYLDPTPMPHGFTAIALVPDPQPFVTFNRRKERMDAAGEYALHDYLASVL